MAKAKRVANVKVGYRMQETVVAMVSNLAEKCGWSESRAAAFLLDVGSASVHATDAKKLQGVVDDAKASVTTATALATATAKAAKLIADAKGEFNAAERKRKGETGAPPVKEVVAITAKEHRKQERKKGANTAPAPTNVTTAPQADVEGQKKIDDILKT